MNHIKTKSAHEALLQDTAVGVLFWEVRDGEEEVEVVEEGVYFLFITAVVEQGKKSFDSGNHKKNEKKTEVKGLVCRLE